MFSRALKMAFWVVYDHLGKLLLANFMCALMVSLPLAFAHGALISGVSGNVVYVALPLMLFALCVVLPTTQAGLVWMIREIIETRDGTLRSFFTGMRRLGPGFAVLGCLYALTCACLLTSAWFYAWRIAPGRPLLGYGLSAVSLWSLLFVVLTSVFAGPAMIYKRTGPAQAFKMAALLTFDNPLLAVALAFASLLLGLAALAPPLFVFFSFAPVAALHCSVYEMLSRKYETFRQRAERGDSNKKLTGIDFRDDDDEYLCRGLRDALFPWKE